MTSNNAGSTANELQDEDGSFVIILICVIVGVVFLVAGATIVWIRVVKRRNSSKQEPNAVAVELKAERNQATDVAVPVSLPNPMASDEEGGVESTAAAEASTGAAAVTASSWEKHFDKSSGEYYYYNVETGETTWECPP